MCGRYTLSAPADLIEDLFDLAEGIELEASFNIAPMQHAPVVRRLPQRRLDHLRWGLVPFWAKDPSIGSRLINARSETVSAKPAFRSSLRKRRCLVVADGFYEWQKAGTRKQPFHFSLKSAQPFAMAGLWDLWKQGPGEPLETFTILTTRPNELVARVHARMPVILSQDSYEIWLDPTQQDPRVLQSLLEPYPPDEMSASAVSTYVNSPHNNGPRCTEPISLSPP